MSERTDEPIYLTAAGRRRLERRLAEYDGEAARRLELIADHETAKQYWDLNTAAVDRCIDEHASLAETIADLEFINRGRTGFYEQLRLSYLGVEDHRELLACYALTKFRSRLADDASPSADALARLASEYHDLFGRPSPTV